MLALRRWVLGTADHLQQMTALYMILTCERMRLLPE